jgi:putative phosphoesterase
MLGRSQSTVNTAAPPQSRRSYGMHIGVISDTHDRVPTFRKAVERFLEENVDAILHAGDHVAPFAAKLLTEEVVGQTPVHAIFGNNDGEREGLSKVLPGLVDGPLQVELGGRTVVMHHYLDWLTEEDVAPADVVISGHDHTARRESRNGRFYLNPGECCGWVMGSCTAAMLDLTNLEARFIEIPAAE